MDRHRYVVAESPISALTSVVRLAVRLVPLFWPVVRLTIENRLPRDPVPCTVMSPPSSMRDGEDMFIQSVVNVVAAANDKKISRINKVLCSSLCSMPRYCCDYHLAGKMKILIRLFVLHRRMYQVWTLPNVFRLSRRCGAHSYLLCNFVHVGGDRVLPSCVLKVQYPSRFVASRQEGSIDLSIKVDLFQIPSVLPLGHLETFQPSS